MDIKVGDKVRFLNEVGGGIVSGFQGKDIVLVQDEDGFDIPMLKGQVVVIWLSGTMTSAPQETQL